MLNGRDRRDYRAFDKDNVVMDGYDSMPRQRAVQKSDRINYQDARTTFTEAQMKKETERCLGCGELFNAVASDMKCPMCESADMEILSGNDLIVQELICR